MGQDPSLPTTSYALLGLLTLGSGLSGYELKQRADKTLRFFWFSPALSQVYAELDRLERLGLVTSTEVAGPGRRSTRRFTITTAGETRLRRWLAESAVEFPVIKHSVALRLFLGHLAEPEQTREMLDVYLDRLEERIAELRQIRAGLGDDPRLRYPALVAEWGLRYYASEIAAVRDLAQRLHPS
jgi:DNA-binding PadR family transcriptional regulator